MNLDEREYFMPKPKRSVGRPAENPFPSPEIEEDFVRRGQAMIDLYYHPTGQNTRKDFVFFSGCAISKTQFWTFVYIYYTQAHGMKENIMGFLNSARRHFGTGVVSDRSRINTCIGSHKNKHLHTKYVEDKDGLEQDIHQSKCYMYYRVVVNSWKECLDLATHDKSACEKVE